MTKIRKYTKNKLSLLHQFAIACVPTDEAVLKSVYLALPEATKKMVDANPKWGFNPQPILNYI